MPPQVNHPTETQPAYEMLIAGLAAVPGLVAEVAALRAEVASLRAERVKGNQRAKWLTLKETADILRCSNKSVTRMIADGRLRRDLKRWRVRIPAEDVEAYAGKVTLPLRR